MPEAVLATLAGCDWYCIGSLQKNGRTSPEWAWPVRVEMLLTERGLRSRGPLVSVVQRTFGIKLAPDATEGIRQRVISTNGHQPSPVDGLRWGAHLATAVVADGLSDLG